MQLARSCVAALLILTPAWPQVFRLSNDQMSKYTAKNPFERFPDGRPKVDDKLLERVKGLSIEEAWGYAKQGLQSSVFRLRLPSASSRTEACGPRSYCTISSAPAGPGGRP